MIWLSDSFELESLPEGVWWFDADSGRRCRAALYFAGGEIRAKNADGGRRDARVSEVRIFFRLGDVPRRITFADGVCVCADDNDFMDAMPLPGAFRTNI